MIRIGGNSGDTTFWTSTGEPAPAWATGGTITPADLRHLATIVKAADWRIVPAVNLKQPDPARAADEARYAEQIFGRSLLGIEIGNEPNFYYGNESAYYAEFEVYAAAIEQAVPGIGLTGPDPDTSHSAYLTQFAADEAGHPDVTEVTQHAYPTSVCGTDVTTIPELLDPDSADLRAYAVRDGGRLTVVLDDVQDPADNGPTTVTLNLGADFHGGRLTALTTSSPAGLSATSGITLGGQQVGPHGSFPPPHSTPVTVHGKTATVTVPAGSAAIIQFS